MPAAKSYSDQEVREILERALKGDADGGSATVTHADLLAIGEQVGVAPEAMARAAEEVALAREDGAITSGIKSARRKWLALHAAIFAVINGSLFLVNYLTTPGEWWFLFSVFFWGLLLVAHAGAALFAGVSSAALERERRKLPGRASKPQLRVEGVVEARAPAALEADTDHTEPTDEARRAAK
jgi:2TM domain